jgi:hypothetical protein
VELKTTMKKSGRMMDAAWKQAISAGLKASGKIRHGAGNAMIKAAPKVAVSVAKTIATAKAPVAIGSLRAAAAIAPKRVTMIGAGKVAKARNSVAKSLVNVSKRSDNKHPTRAAKALVSGISKGYKAGVRVEALGKKIKG